MFVNEKISEYIYIVNFYHETQSIYIKKEDYDMNPSTPLTPKNMPLPPPRLNIDSDPQPVRVYFDFHEEISKYFPVKLFHTKSRFLTKIYKTSKFCN